MPGSGRLRSGGHEDNFCFKESGSLNTDYSFNTEIFPRPVHSPDLMTEMDSQCLLIPIEFPDPDPLPSTFVGGFTTCEVTLLGIYELPEDIDPDERQRREIEAYHTLYSLADDFVRSGDIANVELAMGPNISKKPTEIAEERDLEAVLVPNPITTLGRILVAIRDEEFAQPLAEFLGTLNQENIIHTNVLHVARSEDDREEGERLLSRVCERLVDVSYPQASTETEVIVSDDPSFAISQAARDHDLIIMGETEESGFERVFGKVYSSIAEQTEEPVVVVRK